MKFFDIFIKGAEALRKLVESLGKLKEIFGGSTKKEGAEGGKSDIYKAMSKEGQAKVDGLKKALDAAKDGNNRPEAVRVLKELSNVYAQEARQMNGNLRLSEDAKKASNNLRDLADKVRTQQDAIPGSRVASQNNHTVEPVIIASSQVTLAGIKEASSVENNNDKMYDLALKSFKTRTGLEATPLDAFVVMIDHKVPFQQAKEVALYRNPDEKDSLEANIDKYMDASKAIKEKPTEMASDNEAKVMSKQEQLVA
jgi:hypothetical protein